MRNAETISKDMVSSVCMLSFSAGFKTRIVR